MSNRRSLLILFSILTLSFILLTSYIGTQGPRQPSSNNSGSIITGDHNISLLDLTSYTLKVGVSVSNEEFKLLQEWNEKYRSRNPNIKVTLINLPPGRAYNEFLSDAQLARSFDLMLMENEWVFEFAVNGFLTPVNEAIIDELDNRVPTILEPLLDWNHMLWAVPLDLDPYVLAYHQALTQGNGFAEITSFDQLWDLQENMTIHSTENGFTEGSQLASIEAFASTVDEQFFSDDEEGEESIGDHEEMPAVQSLGEGEDDGLQYGLYYDVLDPYAFFAYLAAVGAIDTENREEWSLHEILPLGGSLEQMGEGNNRLYLPQRLENSPWRLFQEEKLATYITRWSDYSRERSNRFAHIQSQLVPAVNESPTLWVRGRSWTVRANSGIEEQAFRWIHAMTRDEVQLEWATVAHTVPATKSAIQAGKERWPILEAEMLYEAAWTLPPSPNYLSKLSMYRDSVRAFQAGEMNREQFTAIIPQIWNPTSSQLP